MNADVLIAGGGIAGLACADWTATAVPCSMESAVRSAAITAEAAAAKFGRRVRPVSPPPDCTGTVALLREWRFG